MLVIILIKINVSYHSTFDAIKKDNMLVLFFLKLIQRNFNFDHVDHSNFIITDL